LNKKKFSSNKGCSGSSSSSGHVPASFWPKNS
jgi:hypothetical protein